MSAPRSTATRAYYSATVADFLSSSPEEVVGRLTRESAFEVTPEQRDAWFEEISLLREVLAAYSRGLLFFEFVVPRFGRRIDVVLLLDDLVFVMEFKVGEEEFTRSAREQVWDYALDLKNFHETSHQASILPVLIATRAHTDGYVSQLRLYKDGVYFPQAIGSKQLALFLRDALASAARSPIAEEQWEQGSYRPTPTIIEAAKALYARHSIQEISRSDAGAKNLARTSRFVSGLIQQARANNEKAICFVTGVPGAGKTLVGLDVATRHMDPKSELHSVYLSGNGPLVAILREALTRDHQHRELQQGRRMRKGEARQKVESFIQNVHHFRDDCIKDLSPPGEHVAIFDEAQRAWNLRQTIDFMVRKKKRPDFSVSEPEFLISCLDRHKDWAVVVCLVGGGQEIHTGEAGIIEWVQALERSFPHWAAYVSNRLDDTEYGASSALALLRQRANTHLIDDLHLAVSMRSFRSEKLSEFVKRVLDLDAGGAKAIAQELHARYPIRLTRDLSRAKEWLRTQAGGSERYGIVVSSQAQRLKPLAIDVRVAADPVHWFLDGPEDVRSSFYLEEVSTEFGVQGLELDWTCVVWDADLRYTSAGWKHHSFVGSQWNQIRASERQTYLKNAYRVLMTRARQGMVVVVPSGSPQDPTRDPAYYDGTYDYLRSAGFVEL